MTQKTCLYLKTDSSQIQMFERQFALRSCHTCVLKLYGDTGVVTFYKSKPDRGQRIPETSQKKTKTVVPPSLHVEVVPPSQ